MTTSEFRYETWIRATTAEVWRALTSPEFTRQYFHGTSIESSWQPGAAVRFLNPDGSVAVAGKVLACEPERRLSITWHVLYNELAAKEAATRVTFILEPLPEQTRLRVEHDQFPAESVVLDAVSQGWPWIIASLKSLLETGQALPDSAA